MIIGVHPVTMRMHQMHYVSDKQLAARFGVSRPTIWRWLKSDPTFPRPFKLSPQCTRWRDDEIVAWEAASKAGA